MGELYAPVIPYAVIPRLVVERCPEWRDAFWALEEAFKTFFVAVGDTGITSPKSMPTILLQATNEAQALTLAATEGDGRHALASARTLFELAVALRDVISDPDLDDRFSDWAAVGRYLQAQLTLEAQALTGNDRKAYLHRQKVAARDLKGEYDGLVAQYGPNYRRDWAGRTLFDRATGHGLYDLYDFYRLSSGVLHGTELGGVGLRRPHQDPHGTTRLGLALVWAPTALLYGLEVFDLVVKTARPLIPVGVKQVRSAIAQAKKTWPDLRKTILELDEQLWPSEPFTSRVAIYGMGPGGSGQWFVLEPDLGRIIKALPPKGVPTRVEDLITAVRRHYDMRAAWSDSSIPKGIRGYVTIGVAEVQAEPDPSADWEPAGMVMIQDPHDIYSYAEGWFDPNTRPRREAPRSDQ